MSCRVAADERKVNHVTRHNCSGADKRVTTNFKAAKDSGVGSNARSLSHQGVDWLFKNFASGIKIVCKDAVGTKERAVFDSEAAPDEFKEEFYRPTFARVKR